MNEFENGYYWVSYQGMKPVIFEKDDTGWSAMGIETEPDFKDYEILGRVGEWCSDEKEKALHKHVASGSTRIDKYGEIVSPDGGVNECSVCKYFKLSENKQPCKSCTLDTGEYYR